ncbi:MAG TPA: hypothetical protein VL860_07160 [Planctomycetota bacterium]|nr:hypothetical protein [Planctomycetota bacterium]
MVYSPPIGTWEIPLLDGVVVNSLTALETVFDLAAATTALKPSAQQLANSDNVVMLVRASASAGSPGYSFELRLCHEKTAGNFHAVPGAQFTVSGNENFTIRPLDALGPARFLKLAKTAGTDPNGTDYVTLAVSLLGVSRI